MPGGLTSFLDPFADEERARCEVEELARNFENKYVSLAVMMFIAYRSLCCVCVSCTGWWNKEEKKRQNTGSN